MKSNISFSTKKGNFCRQFTNNYSKLEVTDLVVIIIGITQLELKYVNLMTVYAKTVK